MQPPNTYYARPIIFKISQPPIYKKTEPLIPKQAQLTANSPLVWNVLELPVFKNIFSEEKLQEFLNTTKKYTYVRIIGICDLLTIFDMQYGKEFFKKDIDILKYILENDLFLTNNIDVVKCLEDFYRTILDIYGYILDNIEIRIAQDTNKKTALLIKTHTLDIHTLRNYSNITDCFRKSLEEKSGLGFYNIILDIIFNLERIVADFKSYRNKKNKPANYKRIICEHWKKNKCIKSEDCIYAHGEADLIIT